MNGRAFGLRGYWDGMCVVSSVFLMNHVEIVSVLVVQDALCLIRAVLLMKVESAPLQFL